MNLRGFFHFLNSYSDFFKDYISPSCLISMEHMHFLYNSKLLSLFVISCNIQELALTVIFNLGTGANTTDDII
jgi:hypothetical protein